MRDGLLRLHQPGGDGLAHAVERHFLERHVAIERQHLGGRRAARHGSAPARGCVAAAVSTSRATMRPCGPDGVMRLRSMPASDARRRASGVTAVAADAGRPEIALGRAHLEERIERDRWAALPRTPTGLPLPGGERAGVRGFLAYRES